MCEVFRVPRMQYSWLERKLNPGPFTLKVMIHIFFHTIFIVLPATQFREKVIPVQCVIYLFGILTITNAPFTLQAVHSAVRSFSWRRNRPPRLPNFVQVVHTTGG